MWLSWKFHDICGPSDLIKGVCSTSYEARRFTQKDFASPCILNRLLKQFFNSLLWKTVWNNWLIYVCVPQTKMIWLPGRPLWSHHTSIFLPFKDWASSYKPKKNPVVHPVLTLFKITTRPPFFPSISLV